VGDEEFFSLRLSRTPLNFIVRPSTLIVAEFQRTGFSTAEKVFPALLAEGFNPKSIGSALD